MIYSVKTFDLSLTVYKDKYKELVSKAKLNAKILGFKLQKTDFGFTDEVLDEGGLAVEYRNGNKRKIILSVDPGMLLATGNMIDLWKPSEKKIAKMLQELDDHISNYFGHEFELNHFKLNNIVIAVNIKLDTREEVSSYIHVFNKIGSVKGYSYRPIMDKKHKNNATSYNLIGNSNGVEFSAFEMESALINEYQDAKKEISKITRGILTIEVRLTTQKAIRDYTNHDVTADRIFELATKSGVIFANTIIDIIPYGRFYKKPHAVQIVEESVKNNSMRRKMKKLLEHIPKQKSLLYAQKKMGDRNMDDIMQEFRVIDVSPVTLSKRHGVDELENLYDYLMED